MLRRPAPEYVHTSEVKETKHFRMSQIPQPDSNAVSLPPPITNNPLIWEEVQPSPSPPFAQDAPPQQQFSFRPPPPGKRPPPPEGRPPPPPGSSAPKRDPLLNTKVQVSADTPIPEVAGASNVLAALAKDPSLFDGTDS